jgi:hypothetical protein
VAKSFPNTGATVIDTSADLPAASAALEGVMMFQKDTNELKICDGSSWVSVIDTDNKPLDGWTSWVPTWANLSVGNGVVTAKYINIGKLVSFHLYVDFGTTTSVSGDVTFSLPVNNAHMAVGTGWLDVGSAYMAFPLILNNICYVRCWNASSTYLVQQFISSTVPGTWNSASQITIFGTYEAA